MQKSSESRHAFLAAVTLALMPLVAGAADDPALLVETGVVIDALRPRSAPASVLSHVDVRLTADAGKGLGWTGTVFRFEALADHGGKPNGRVGTLQGLSNIEVRTNAVRLYSLWASHDFASGINVLAGLYDLNSEFYATEASSSLIHPAFGIGSELGQTGRNGPSIFPDLAVGLRVRARSDDGYYAQGVALDAVAGDHADDVFAVRWRRADGALLVGEAGWQGEPVLDSEIPSRWGIGAWGYTKAVRRLGGVGAATNLGVYVIGQAPIGSAASRAPVAFVRAGVADPRVNRLAAALDAGVTVDHPWGPSGPATLTSGIAIARLGRAYRAAQATFVRAEEVAFEIGARWRFGRALAVQPLVQRVWNVAGRRDATATVIGVRAIWSFASNAGP